MHNPTPDGLSAGKPRGFLASPGTRIAISISTGDTLLAVGSTGDCPGFAANRAAPFEPARALDGDPTDPGGHRVRTQDGAPLLRRRTMAGGRNLLGLYPQNDSPRTLTCPCAMTSTTSGSDAVLAGPGGFQLKAHHRRRNTSSGRAWQFARAAPIVVRVPPKSSGGYKARRREPSGRIWVLLTIAA